MSCVAQFGIIDKFEKDKDVSKDPKSKSSEELINLMILLRKAISENKYVIHYGA